MKLRTSSSEFQDSLDMFQRWEHKNENVFYIVVIEANRFDKNGIFHASSSTIQNDAISSRYSMVKTLLPMFLELGFCNVKCL